ncbi:MAG: hypothetical protein JNL38_29200 [Myxococcales bacterium]|jgi:uncharacterized tellurite resistance protein B-like protein|nr:hypothetical protein [Myxococcales bacterium]
MSKRTPNFARVLGGAAALSPGEIDAILAIGYAMANANGDASFDELESFRALVKHLRSDASVMETLDALSARLESAGSAADLARAAAAELPTPAGREAAYKAACTIAVFDLETNEEERDLDDVLVEALGLADRAGDLELEVNTALST